MPTSTVTSKGQTTIPVEVRRRLGLTAGSRLQFVPTDSGTYEIVPMTVSVRSLKGVVAAPGVPVSLDEMDRAIFEGASRRAISEGASGRADR